MLLITGWNFLREAEFSLLKDRLEDSSEWQKIKEIIVPHRNSHLMENDFNDP